VYEYVFRNFLTMAAAFHVGEGNQQPATTAKSASCIAVPKSLYSAKQRAPVIS
jgi:hypothetical protein